MVPEFLIPQLFAADWQAVPYPTGFAGAVVALQVPPQVIVPAVVWPQAFAGEVHALPYPAGRPGVVALHAPVQPIVPVLIWPHAFGAEVQLLPYPVGFGGAVPVHWPLQLSVPMLIEGGVVHTVCMVLQMVVPPLVSVHHPLATASQLVFDA
jgi:hypothetical protein